MSQLLDRYSLRILRVALERLEAGFDSLPQFDHASTGGAELDRVLSDVAERLRDNYPYFHPLYAGQMLTPPHPVARAAYTLAMWLNPNNHALDGGRASSAMEKEAVAEIAAMFGWDEHLGHLTGGGTMANLEALWVAGQLHPGKTVLASDQAHYTHRRISAVLGLKFESVICDRRGRMDIAALTRLLERGDIGTVVATMGTTAIGSIDPLTELLDLQQRFQFRLHADAAYGGYFGLADNLDEDGRQAFHLLNKVDSIVIDPHKHGLQPYGCGCVVFRDPSVGQLYKHDSPYTYFSSAELHLGEISLECSRPGAAAVGLWATQRLFPLERGGEFAGMKSRSRAAALELYRRLCDDNRIVTAFEPELDIVVWALRSTSVSESSTKARLVFDEAAKLDLHLAIAELPFDFFAHRAPEMTRDRETITCLRSVLMKAEHLDWVGRIWEKLDAATRAVLKRT